MTTHIQPTHVNQCKVDAHGPGVATSAALDAVSATTACREPSRSVRLRSMDQRSVSLRRTFWLGASCLLGAWLSAFVYVQAQAPASQSPPPQPAPRPGPSSALSTHATRASRPTGAAPRARRKSGVGTPASHAHETDLSRGADRGGPDALRVDVRLLPRTRRGGRRNRPRPDVVRAGRVGRPRQQARSDDSRRPARQGHAALHRLRRRSHRHRRLHPRRQGESGNARRRPPQRRASPIWRPATPTRGRRISTAPADARPVIS